MDNIEQIVNLAMNSGMSIMITVYFLYRDWKYQGQLISLMSNISSVLSNLVGITEGLRRFHANDE